MQHGVMSVSKSVGVGIAMLWLAEEYGPDVFDLLIVDGADVRPVGGDVQCFGMASSL